LERITISLDSSLADEFDQFITEHGYRNRSEAMRDLIRLKLESERLDKEQKGHCIGTLTYVFNHEERELARRLTSLQHEHHNLAVSTLHVHLDHENCLETVVVQGPTGEVRSFANELIARPGVRHGELYLVPVDVKQSIHQHGEAQSRHTHRSPHT
jgi:CopG family transcriptional regulator, nickel-responsive regulator